MGFKVSAELRDGRCVLWDTADAGPRAGGALGTMFVVDTVPRDDGIWASVARIEPSEGRGGAGGASTSIRCAYSVQILDASETGLLSRLEIDGEAEVERRGPYLLPLAPLRSALAARRLSACAADDPEAAAQAAAMSDLIAAADSVGGADPVRSVAEAATRVSAALSEELRWPPRFVGAIVAAAARECAAKMEEQERSAFAGPPDAGREGGDARLRR